MSDTNTKTSAESLEKPTRISLISVSGKTLQFGSPDKFDSQSLAEPAVGEPTIKSCFSVSTYLAEVMWESFALAGACMCPTSFYPFYSRSTDTLSTMADPGGNPWSLARKRPS